MRLSSVSAFGTRFERIVLGVNPWTNTYGLGRTILASATFMTLAINGAHLLFRPSSDSNADVKCVALAKSISLFCLLSQHLDAARILACFVLVPVIVGVCPRVTGLMHWWVSYSFYTSAKVTDGGEQVAAVITLMLLPLTLCDSRKWHWSVDQRLAGTINRAVALLAYWTLQLQVAFIYLDASIEKLRVAEWQDGTNMFYILASNFFGAPSYLRPVLWHIITSPMIAVITWSVLVLEFALGVNVLLPRQARLVLLQLAILFHIAIALTLGIASFSLIMIGALVLGLAPIGCQLSAVFAIRAPSQFFERRSAA